MQIQFHSVWKNWNDKFKQKKFEIDLVIKLCGKILYPTESVKYLSGCEIVHVGDLLIVLIRVSAVLFKMRKQVSLKILRSICFGIFDSYLYHCCLVWSQNCSNFQQIVILQKKLLELLIFNQGISVPVPYSTKAPP